jgi:N-(2-amino-2-carboxyethyl)-L-glutamate synthase
MPFDSVLECVGNTPLVRLHALAGNSDVEILAKLEMLNPSGSLKDRTAKFMIERGMEDGTIKADTHLVESSSGNFAIAAAVAAKVHQLEFTCVVDPKICDANLKILELLDTTVSMVDEKDDTGGYLKTRLARVEVLLQRIDGAVWMNQYVNEANWRAHYDGIAGEIISEVEDPPDCAVIAVSTSGTIMGIARRLSEVYPSIKVVAVDVHGSVIFGGPGRERFLPGIGSSIEPAILDRSLIDDVIWVSDAEAIDGAHELLATEGILAGGSSGAVVAAIKRVAATAPTGYRIVTVFPDRGERYFDTVFARSRRATKSRVAPLRRQSLGSGAIPSRLSVG